MGDKYYPIVENKLEPFEGEFIKRNENIGYNVHFEFLSEEEKAIREQMWIEYLHESLYKFDKEKVIKIFKEQQKHYDFTWRIVREDDVHYMITQDLKSNRINLEFDNNYLSKSYLG